MHRAAAAFGVDDVIEPPHTRQYLIAALEMTSAKQARQLGRKTPLFP